jgi:hypothetical protein
MYVLYNINYSLDFIFSELILNLSEKFFINNLLKLFYNKLVLVQQSSNCLNDDIIDMNELDYINLIDIHIFYIILNDFNEIDG